MKSPEGYMKSPEGCMKSPDGIFVQRKSKTPYIIDSLGTFSLRK